MTLLTPEQQGSWHIVAPQGSQIKIIVVGAGGTGSQLIPNLARLVWDWNRQSEDRAGEKRRASLLIVDDDFVAEKNVRARQNFCPPEIGFPKAQVLANRYALAFSMRADEISALVSRFSAEMIRKIWDDLIILVGCVDNAPARAELAHSLELNRGPVPHIWYLDAGNGFHWGQVFIGNTPTLEKLRGCLHESLGTRLLSPAFLAPSLFEVPRKEGGETTTVRLSCGDLVLSEQEGNRQSRTINTHMASLLYAYVERLLYSSLTTFATYTNLSTFETHSDSITPEALARTLGKPASFFTMQPADEHGEEETEDEGADLLTHP